MPVRWILVVSSIPVRTICLALLVHLEEPSYENTIIVGIVRI